MTRERQVQAVSGWVVLPIVLAGLLAALAVLITGARTATPSWVVGGAISMVFFAFLLGGLFVVNPNEAKVLQLFGEVRRHGARAGAALGESVLHEAPRVAARPQLRERPSSRSTTPTAIPIEIAAVVVWRVVDTAEAVFEVDDYENYVHVQSEVGAAQHGHQLPVRRAR